jgi:hypothetical protein
MDKPDPSEHLSNHQRILLLVEEALERWLDSVEVINQLPLVVEIKFVVGSQGYLEDHCEGLHDR